MDETELIQTAKEGDLTSFNRLILKYQDMAFNVAYRIMGDSMAAEDATQTAFISAYQKINTFRGGSFKSWVLRIVTNACYDELRRQKRRPTTPLEPFNEDDEEFDSPHWIADPGESPEDAAVRSELSDAIQECLDGLGENFRIVIVLVDIQGMDYSEASNIIKKPLGTVKSRLARARLKMRDCLQGFWELLPSAFRLEMERTL